MNQQVYDTLESLPAAERPGYLLALGLDEQQATDLLAWMEKSAALPEAKPRRTSGLFTESETWAKIQAKVQELRTLPPVASSGYEPPSEEAVKFDRDILLNQYLMGGSTIYDQASLYNPTLVKTEVISWLKEIFRTSHYRSALIVGGPGSGKTWGSLAYMNSLTTARGRDGKVVWADSMFLTAFRLSEMFHNQRKFQEELDTVLKKKHLLIDDLGAEPSGFRGSDFIAYFDYLFSERHKYRRYTFLTSNATAPQIKELYGERFTSRFNDEGSYKETTQTDMRGPHTP